MCAGVAVPAPPDVECEGSDHGSEEDAPVHDAEDPRLAQLLPLCHLTVGDTHVFICRSEGCHQEQVGHSSDCSGKPCSLGMLLVWSIIGDSSFVSTSCCGHECCWQAIGLCMEANGGAAAALDRNIV
jgi:hypothetical protein